MIHNPLFDIDFYKVDHRRQYPEGTTEIYSNFTPRYVNKCHSLLPDFDDQVVVFGVQHLVKEYLIEHWHLNFFFMAKEVVVNEYKTLVEKALGIKNFDCSHIEALHDLGYLPIRIKAIQEGHRVPIGMPILTIVNTHPDFFWLTNYLETMISAILWKPITCATIAFEFKRLLSRYAEKTGVSKFFVPFQLHDFSFRGMSGIEDAALCGAAHLTSFVGTDCVVAIALLNRSYNAHKYTIHTGLSVPATEHSVMCCDGEDKEFETIYRLITEVYPEGTVSIVADSYNLWRTITEYLPLMCKKITEREGKVVIRPDSGDPVKIICGDWNAPLGTKAFKGALQLLWEIFGGTVNDKGYKELDRHIGLIYGDAITIERASLILQFMELAGFASSNIIFGVGSYTYQYVTRDTFGFAMKATSAVINGERRAIYKDPITSDGSKKSAKGLLMIDIDNETAQFELHENVTENEEKEGYLVTVFEHGMGSNLTNLGEIRHCLDEELELVECKTYDVT